MLVYSILNKEKNNLKFLSKSDENIDLSMTAITEFKKHGIEPEVLKKEIENIEDEYLKTKLNDMYLIYKNFEEKLQGHYIEDTDLLTFLAEHIEETNMIDDSIIYIDEFSGFTYQEYQVLKKFIKLAKQVTITICTDSPNLSINPDTDIFYSNKKTLSKILDLAKEENLKIEESIFLKEFPRFKNEELKHLEENIFNKRIHKYEKKVENIDVFLAKNQYSEIENMAKKIVDLVKNEKLRYRDIAIITKNIDTYSSLIRSIFKAYNIPVFIDEKRDLNQNIVVQYLLSIFEIFSSNFSRESIFNYLKIGFSDIEDDDIFKLENYCIKWGIKQNKWKSDFVYGKDEKNEEEIEYLNHLRKQIIEPLVNLKEKFGNAFETTKAIYVFLQEQRIEEKISLKIEELQKLGEIDLASEYNTSYNIILNLLDEIVLIFSDEKIGISKYLQILKTGLKNSELGKIPGTQDQVIVGDTDRSRSHKVDTIFIIGLNDGSFPSVNRQEGFFGDKDREILKNDGIELANGTIENLYEENFNIYKAFTTAENKLFLSYASSESEGKALRPSMMINKIKKIFPMLEEKSDVIDENREYESNEIVKEQEKIDKNIIEKLYGNTLSTSVSKLERFAQCPFSYYLQYGLRLKEKEELKVQRFDTGSFMHETIDEFFKLVKEKNIRLPDFVTDETKIKELVDNVVEEKLEWGKKYSFVATPKYKILVKRLKRIVAKALKYIIEGLVYSDFNIEGTEIEFGRNGKYKPIQIVLEDGKKVEITGKIDRIDTARTENGKYLRIIDYKSSVKNIDLNEVYAGLQLQLLTYMDAVCREEDLLPAGVLYFGLLEQMITKDNKVTSKEIEDEIQKNFKMKGLILADVNVIQMQDRNLKPGKTSNLIPAALLKSGEIYENRTSCIDKEQFRILQDYIYKTIKEISKEILKGNINIKPYNKKGKTPCENCSYKSICGFDDKIQRNCYNYIDIKTKDDIIRKIKNEK